MKKRNLIPDETVIRKICLFRGEKVLMDRDLAELYGVEQGPESGSKEKYPEVP